jgi:8-hydroxy-5-deazaflavin:NADPH oxidoreductase
MRVAVIGSGNIGATVGRAWARADHHVVFGERDTTGAKVVAALGEAPHATAASVPDAVRGAAAVLFAVPGAALGDVVGGLGSSLGSAVLIDASNNMAGGPMDGTATIQAAVPGAAVYRAFNSLGWENFAAPTFGGVAADRFYCGPGGDGDAVVTQLIADVGLRPVRVGDLDQVEVVDCVTRLWFALSRTRGHHLAFKVLEG